MANWLQILRNYDQGYKLLIGKISIKNKTILIKFIKAEVWSMNRKIKITTQVFWQYFNQQIFNTRSVWDMKRFWYIYQINLFRKCWQQECSHESKTQY